MHASSATHAYLKISSNPVIEKCTDIGFGPLPSGLDPPSEATDNADEQTDFLPYIVQDFDWIGTSHSPNWSPIGRANFQLPVLLSEDNLDSVLGAFLPQVSTM